MRKVHLLAGGLVFAAALAGGATVASAETNAANTCRVSVDRTQAAGTFQVQRQEMNNGDCVCYVYTGPASQGDAAESRVADVQRSRACADRPAALQTEPGVKHHGDALIPAIGGVAAVGLGVAAIASSDSSPGG